jgi:methionyl-tRNA formyltransferase
MKIVLVTHDSVFSRFLASELAEAGAVDQVFVEYGRPSRKFFLKKLKSVGPINFLFQYRLNRWFRKRGQQVLPAVTMPPHQSVENINRHQFAEDELPVGFGTSYITRKTLKRAAHGFLNLHTGVLPQYRGVKSEFWSLYHKDYGNLGWTLHYMTPKLDEGDIVHVGRVPYEGEDPAELRAKLLRHAVPVLTELFARIKADGVDSLPRTPQSGGAYFTTPTRSEWRRFKRNRSIAAIG